MTGSRPLPDRLVVLWGEVVLSGNDELIWGV